MIPSQKRLLEPAEMWYYFFKEARSWEQLPDEINTEAMRQAMHVLEQFSEKEAHYYQYQARQNFLREQRDIQAELEEALQEKQEALQEKQEALNQVQRLEAILKKLGIDPHQIA